MRDVEGALKGYFQSTATVTGTAAGSRTWLAPGDSPTFPFIIVTRLGGGEDTSTVPMDNALVQIDVWGRVRQLSEANTVREAVRVALDALTDTPYAEVGKGRLIGAQVTDERRFPEPEAQDADGTIGERPRYIITARVVVVDA